MSETDVKVDDRPDRGRFEAWTDDEIVGVIEYRADGDTVVAEHTEVADEFQGEGVASQLVAGMVEQLRSDGRILEPRCSYVRSWLERHPDAADVATAPSGEGARR